MKKLTLLLTLLSIGALNGMEPETPQIEYWNLLPREVKNIVLNNLYSSNNKDEIIKNLRSFSLVNKRLNTALNNLKTFTAITHMLAQRFNLKPMTIAQEFNTSAAKEYLQLYETLKTAMSLNDVEGFNTAITKGADLKAENINRLFFDYYTLDTQKPPKYAITKVLLEHGANPHQRNLFGSALTYLNYYHKNTPEYEQIKKLLENAMENQK